MLATADLIDQKNPLFPSISPSISLSQAAPGESYQSRLSAFEESLLRIRMPVLSLSSVGGPGPPRGQPSERPGSRLTVVADLPLTPDPGQARRLVQALGE